jgi:N-acetylneuraminic acid mutarotase
MVIIIPLSPANKTVPSFNMKRKIQALILLLLVFLTPGCSDAEWRFVSPMPHARYGHDATLGPDGKIYVMGGYVWYFHNGMYSNLVYDPGKDLWKYLEPVPGWGGSFMIFDPEKKEWRYVGKMKGEKDYFRIYDRATRKFRYKQIPPEKIRKTNVQREGDGVAIVTGKDGFIYWLGGNGTWASRYGEAIVLPYDPRKRAWPDIGSKRVYYSPHAYRDKTVYKTQMPPMIDRRIDHEAVVISDGRIYAMGGRQKERNEDAHGNVTGSAVSVLDTVECYDPGTNKWEYKKPMSSERMLFAAVVGPDDKIYVFGGSAGLSTEPSTPVLDTTEVYDPHTDTWSTRTPMPAPRWGHAGVLGADGRIYIMGGGKGYDGSPLKDLFIYDPVKDTWKKGPSMNLPRHTLAAVATTDGKIYAIGGTDVGAYGKIRNEINFFLPKKHRLYTGKVQNTVEVLDIFKLK